MPTATQTAPKPAAPKTTTRKAGTPKAPQPKATRASQAKVKTPPAAPAVKTPPAKAAPEPKPAPEPAPEPKPEPKPSIQDAKRDLARRAVEAISAMVANLDGSELALTAMTKEEAAVAASQWIHHLPAGNREDGKRWWAEGLPRPVRSDWK